MFLLCGVLFVMWICGLISIPKSLTLISVISGLAFVLPNAGANGLCNPYLTVTLFELILSISGCCIFALWMEIVYAPERYSLIWVLGASYLTYLHQTLWPTSPAGLPADIRHIR